MNTCSTCSHPQRAEIDSALIQGTPLRNVARQYGASLGALHRHKRAHLSARLAKAQQALEVTQATTLVHQIRDIMADAKVIQKQAEHISERAQKANDWPAATSALREARGCLSEIRECSELLAEAVGELKRGGGVNVAVAVAVGDHEKPLRELSDEEFEERKTKLLKAMGMKLVPIDAVITLPETAGNNITTIVESQETVETEPPAGPGHRCQKLAFPPGAGSEPPAEPVTVRPNGDGGHFNGDHSAPASGGAAYRG